MQYLFPYRWKRGFTFFFVILILAALLTGCLGGGNATTNPSDTQPVSPTLPAGVTPLPGGTAQLIPTAQGIATSQQGQPTPTSVAVIPVTGQGQDLQSQYIQIYQQANPGVVNLQLDVNSNGQSGQVLGSGWIYDTQGDIITNNHVVAGGTNLIVTFFDGFQETGKILGTDPYSDLAVVQVAKLPANVHTLKPASKQAVQVGQVVVAIGSPFGLGSTMTTGVVSALGREIQSLVNNFSIPQAIQTDASINPGNSGGPLIDLNGQVIGVNSQIATNGTNQSSGVGFAIPINIVSMVVPQLISQGKYNWPYLGVAGASVDLLIQQANKLPAQQGAYIDQITPGSPAEKAGLLGSSGTATVMNTQVPTGGDVIVAVNGQAIVTYDDLLIRVGQNQPGDKITLSVLHGGQKYDVLVQLAARPTNIPSNGGASSTN
jgi:S1-C subfamily serine protease